MKKFWIFAVSMLAVTAAAQQRSRGEFSITGRLANAVSGDTVRNASVQIVSTAERGKTQSFQAGSGGTFEFLNLAPGKYSLTAQARGYPPQAFEQHSGFSTAIAVGENKVSTDLVFRLQPEGSITGRILDEHNEPVRD